MAFYKRFVEDADILFQRNEATAAKDQQLARENHMDEAWSMVVFVASDLGGGGACVV